MAKNETSVTLSDIVELIEGGNRVLTRKIDDVEKRLTDKIDGVNKEASQINGRLDRIENLLLKDHLNRIEKLEQGLHAVKVKVGIENSR